jgi:superfamily II DNA or RNA helicase
MTQSHNQRTDNKEKSGDPLSSEVSTITLEEKLTRIFQFSQEQFSLKMILQGEKLLDQHKVALSFQKGRSLDYFVISGIVKDIKHFETKIIFKESTPQQYSLTGSCQCPDAALSHYCAHAYALFIIYIQQFASPGVTLRKMSLPKKISTPYFPHLSGDEKMTAFSPQLSPDLSQHSREVSLGPGSIISNPKEHYGEWLVFHKNQPSTLELNDVEKNILLQKIKEYQFQLEGGKLSSISKVISLDMETPHLHITFYPTIPLAIDQNILESKYFFIKIHKKSLSLQQPEQHKISILDFMFLFDWDSAALYHLQKEQLFHLIYLCSQSPYIPLEEVLYYVFNSLDTISFNIAGIDSSLLRFEPSNLHLNIQLHQRHESGQIQIFFQSDDFLKTPFYPGIKFIFLDLLKLFHRHKSLSTHSNYFYDLFQDYLKTKELNSLLQQLGKSEIGSFKKVQIEHLLTRKNEFSVDLQTGKIFKSEKTIILDFFTELDKTFGGHFLEHIHFKNEDQVMTLTISNDLIMAKLSDFHQTLSRLSIPMTFNGNILKQWKHSLKIERISSQQDWFQIQVELSPEELDYLKDLKSQQQVILKQDITYLLDNQSFQILNFLKKYQKFLPQSSRSNDQLFTLNISKTKIFELFELFKNGYVDLLKKEEIELCEKLLHLEQLPVYSLPTLKTSDIRSYQVTGFQWLSFLYEYKLGACLADDMGLGKTLQSIMFLKRIYSEDKKILILCPVSILLNWVHEFEKFTDLTVHIYYGGQRQIEKEHRIIITSYGVMKREIETTFKNIQFDVLILDEVQHLKNVKSQGAQAARKIQSKFRICLTGTPLENNIIEFYNIMDLSLPGIWSELNVQKNKITTEQMIQVKKIIRPFVLRRTKAQVLKDLPEKSDNYIYLNFGLEESSYYKKKLLDIRNKISSKQETQRYGEVLKGLLELRKCCLWQNHPHVLSTKIQFLLDTLEQILCEDHQVIIFSQFTTYLDLIGPELKKKEWTFSRIDGQQTFIQRQKQVELFQEGKTKIFLISLKAGGVGLNLTQASYVFLMDPWWNPAVENQAIDRAYRIGQKKKLHVYRPIIKNTVEEKVLGLQQQKRELFHQILDDAEGIPFDGKLSMKDFEMLLSL